MPGLILDRTAAVWRMNAATGGYTETPVFSAIRCAILPVSKFDAQVSYALQSTHVIWVAHWLELRKEDELRVGRRLADAFGNVQPWIYVINGRSQFSPGIPTTAFYASERE